MNLHDRLQQFVTDELNNTIAIQNGEANKIKVAKDVIMAAKKTYYMCEGAKMVLDQLGKVLKTSVEEVPMNDRGDNQSN